MQRLFLFLVGVTTALAARGVTCPKCLDPYDYTSCTQTQTCHSHDVCELQVHLADNNRMEYACFNSHACTNHEAHACDPINHEMCAYCCSTLDSCRQQRESIFAKLSQTTKAPVATTMLPAGSTMPPAGSTMPPAGSTMPPAGSTMPPAGSTMPPAGSTMPPAGSTMPPAGTTMPPAGSTMPSANPSMCIQCGDSTTDCTAVQLLLAAPTSCPADKPYCYNRIVQTPTETHIVKGCMDMPTCEQQWWNATSPKPECQTVDPTSPANKDCTFCCEGDSCNKDTKPIDTTLLQFTP
ncbi:hypothetical protein EGW08_019562 [Elysia chlorotica]|uniref:UPAR/Ly6 domain-containing protein n=1 Tax=Elysia chlorotica TaxID=188477 RepID=A0A3S0Z7T7_ELYCH|nr:hypothetical protein EGW08_019562 [Elysia chlorotica]